MLISQHHKGVWEVRCWGWLRHKGRALVWDIIQLSILVSGVSVHAVLSGFLPCSYHVMHAAVQWFAKKSPTRCQCHDFDDFWWFWSSIVSSQMKQRHQVSRILISNAYFLTVFEGHCTDTGRGIGILSTTSILTLNFKGILWCISKRTRKETQFPGKLGILKGSVR